RRGTGPFRGGALADRDPGPQPLLGVGHQRASGDPAPCRLVLTAARPAKARLDQRPSSYRSSKGNPKQPLSPPGVITSGRAPLLRTRPWRRSSAWVKSVG